MKTSYGLEYRLLPPERIEDYEGYDKSVAQCHIANCGRIIVDSVYEQPIDSEFDLGEIYTLLKHE